MSIEVRFGNYIFSSERGDIWLEPYPNVVTDVAPISNRLEATAFSIRVKTRAFGEGNVYTSLGEFYSTSGDEEYVVDNGNVLDTDYGEPLSLYENGAQKGRFYITSVEREGREKVCIKATSAIGLLMGMPHRGGIYAGVACGDIIAEIMQGIEYDIADDVASTTMFGWLPATNTKRNLSARDNLQQVLFATGACLTEDEAGRIRIAYPNNEMSASIPKSRIFLTGSPNVKKNKLSKLTLTEHSFFESASSTEEVLYDNTDGLYVTGYEVFFDKPFQSYRGDGLTVVDSGANWAKITGTGVLYGVPYIHALREIVIDTGVLGGKDVKVSDATLVSSLNSANTADRLVAYYNGTIDQVSDIVLSTEKAGDFVNYTDAFGDERQGVISGIDATVSSFRRGTISVLTGWIPQGLGNVYTEYFIVTADENGVINIPPEHVGKQSLVVMFSGAEGGAGGFDGTNGGSAQAIYPEREDWYERGMTGGDPGRGGAPGEPGGCGRYLQFEIPALAASYSGHIGAGGQGGDHNGEPGQIGEDTTLDAWTTANGIVPDGNVINMLDGTVYGEQGDAGTPGKDGGKGGDWRVVVSGGYSSYQLDPGENGENYNTLWKGGKGALPERGSNQFGSYFASGSAGGGAAFGKSGDPAFKHNPEATSGWIYTDGGDGADAVTPAQAGFYRGGNGGHGGGGGGGGGFELYRQNSIYWASGVPGQKGLGSKGGQGANGFILFYV